MKGSLTVILSVTLVSVAFGANEEAGFDPQRMPPGSIVKVAARRPAVNIGKAEVVSCTTNQLVIRYKLDRFTIEATNVLHLTMVDRAQMPLTAEGQTNSVAMDLSGSRKSQWLTALVCRVKSYFK